MVFFGSSRCAQRLLQSSRPINAISGSSLDLGIVGIVGSSWCHDFGVRVLVKAQIPVAVFACRTITGWTHAITTKIVLELSREYRSILDPLRITQDYRGAYKALTILTQFKQVTYGN
jgi:hypothetical protein